MTLAQTGVVACAVWLVLIGVMVWLGRALSDFRTARDERCGHGPCTSKATTTASRIEYGDATILPACSRHACGSAVGCSGECGEGTHEAYRAIIRLDGYR